MSASQATRDLLVEYYAAMESNDPRRYGAYYADEMTLTFGNSPTITGRENIVVAFTEVLSRVQSLHHDLVNVWEQADGVVVYESVGRWNLFDGTAGLDQRLHGAHRRRRQVHRSADLCRQRPPLHRSRRPRDVAALIQRALKCSEPGRQAQGQHANGVDSGTFDSSDVGSP